MRRFVSFSVARFFVTLFSVWAVSFSTSAQSRVPETAPLLGGSPTDLSASPVALILTREYMCTGLLVGAQEVLTAGHCIASAASDFVVIVGSEKHSVTTVVRNSQFNVDAPATLAFIKHDLGMLLLTTPVTTVTPVPVLNDLPTTDGDTLSVIGRGANEVPDSEQPLGTGRRADFLVDDANGSVIVTTNLVLDGTTCPGDSGAPVFKTIGGSLFAVGVVSAGTSFTRDNGRCVSSGRGLSVFVDLQSEFSKLFLSQFDGVKSASGRTLFVAEKLVQLSQRVTTRNVSSRAPKLIRELLKLRKYASTEQLSIISRMVRTLRSVSQKRGDKAHTAAVRNLKIELGKLRIS